MTGIHPFADPAAPVNTVAEVNLSNIAANIDVIRGKRPDVELVGVVKADGYGHGAVEVARVLVDEGLSFLAVATLAEARILRQAGIEVPILVLAAPLKPHVPFYVDHRLDMTVSSVEIAVAAADFVNSTGASLRVHVKVDTGMHRLGMPASDLARSVEILEGVGVALVGLWTHFASAGQEESAFTKTQSERFASLVARYGSRFNYVHQLNSAAIFRRHDLPTLRRPELARVGISIYGIGYNGEPEMEDLRPAMRLVSRVVLLKTIDAGEGVSYGQRWRAERDSLIATIGAGYADGYPRLAGGDAWVGIGGSRFPIVGTICMDMMMLDLGPPDGPGKEVAVGDEVVLFGPGGPSARQVASWAQTIPYELCTGIGPRVPRHYVRDHLR